MRRFLMGLVAATWILACTDERVVAHGKHADNGGMAGSEPGGETGAASGTGGTSDNPNPKATGGKATGGRSAATENAGGAAGSNPSTGGASDGGTSGRGGQTSAAGEGGTPDPGRRAPALCSHPLTGDNLLISEACSFDEVCTLVGCGAIDGELDQCGNERALCKSNADCRENEVCTPLAAWGIEIGCGVECGLGLGAPEGTCGCGANDCIRTSTACTLAAGLPEPCQTAPDEDRMAAILGDLATETASTMAPEVDRPNRLCLQKYADTYEPSGYECGEVCGNSARCPDDCDTLCQGDPQRFYEELVATVLASTALGDTPACRLVTEKLR
jgi:hypothetical protein